jgi:hypothetical protein
VAHEVDEVRDLLGDLPARARPRRPPGGRGHLVEPPGREQAERTAVEQCTGPLHGVEAAPVVAGGGDETGRVDLGGDALGRRQVGGERLLDEQRQAVLDGDGLGLAVGERRHADVQRVGPHRPRERGGVGEGRGSASLRQRLGPDRVGVRRADHRDARQARQDAGVALAHAARADQPHPHQVTRHHALRLPRRRRRDPPYRVWAPG